MKRDFRHGFPRVLEELLPGFCLLLGSLVALEYGSLIRIWLWIIPALWLPYLIHEHPVCRIGLWLSAFLLGWLWTGNQIERHPVLVPSSVLVEGNVVRVSETEYGKMILLRDLQWLSPDSIMTDMNELLVFGPEELAPKLGSPLKTWCRLRTTHSPETLPLPHIRAMDRWETSWIGSIKDMRLVQYWEPETSISGLSKANQELFWVFARGVPSSIWRDRLAPFGLGHLLAISGLHTALFALALHALLLGLRRPIWRVLVLSGALCCFGWWMGWSASVARASMMLIIWHVLPLLLRERQGFRIWFFLWIANGLLWAPQLWSMGVWFSFTACLGIMLGHRKLPRDPRVHPWRRTLRYIFPILGAQLMVVPLNWCFTGATPWFSVFWNLIALVFLMLLGLLWLGIFLAHLMPSLNGVVNAAESQYATFLHSIGSFAQGPDPIVAWPLPFFVLALVILLCGLMLKFGPPEKRWYLALLPLLLWWFVSAFKTSPNVTLLDVGQGQCLLAKINQKNFLIDVGGQLPPGVNLETVLRLYGVHRLDGIIVTHFNADHYNLIEDLDEDIPIFIPDTQIQAFQGHPAFQERKISGWSKGQHGLLEIHWPPAGLKNAPNYNESGLILRLVSEGRSYWIAGDAGIWVEERLEIIPRTDVLVVGHHGSRSATSQAFLAQLQPEEAWISCGRNNRFNHPHPEVLYNLGLFAVPFWSTSKSGSLSCAD